MDFRVTIGLLVVLAALGGYFFFTGGTTPAPVGVDATATAQQASRVTVLDITPSDITSVTLAPLQGDTVTVARDDDGWQVTAPTTAAADANRIDSALGELGDLTAQRTVTPADDSDAAAFGLDEPLYTITLARAAGDDVTLLVGSNNPSNTASYVQVQGDATIYLIENVRLSGVQQWATTPPVAPTPLPTVPPTDDGSSDE